MSLDGTSGLSEAEIQVLIATIELASPKETPNNNHYVFYPKTLDDAATYFRESLEDWTDAYGSLVAKGLLVRDGKGYALTERGVLQADQVRDARPPIWCWYTEFYAATAQSQAYTIFCERLYGKYVCQAGFSDMDQLQALIDIIAPSATSFVLDLGCGSGWVAEYLSDVTGAHVSGIDYCPEAIRQAQERTRDKRHRQTLPISCQQAWLVREGPRSLGGFPAKWLRYSAQKEVWVGRHQQEMRLL